MGKLRSAGCRCVVSLAGAIVLAACGGSNAGQQRSAAPTVTAGVQKTTVTWAAVTGATAYNLYWANGSGVSKTSGTKIANVTSPYVHDHLAAGTYYYVVTSVSGNGESAESQEASAGVALLVFVTSTSGTGNLSSWADAGGQTGLAAGDAICQARATVAGRSGTFKAWLSDATNDAYCRIHGMSGTKATNCGQTTLPVAAGPWVRMDGFPFAPTIDQLVKPVVYAPVRYNESGQAVAAGTDYYTATSWNGAHSTGSTATCNDWTSSVQQANLAVGMAEDAGGGWTAAWGRSACDTQRPLVCMQTGVGPSVAFVPSTGKKVFVTSTSGTGNLSSWADAGGQTGLAAGDAICQARVTAAGLSGTFKAWLSDAATDAKDRITSNGPWVRPDGVKVADDKADLLDGALFTSIGQTEAGTYLSTRGIWTGTLVNGTKAPTNCTNWTATSGTGERGGAEGAGTEWTESVAEACGDFWLSLYCIED